MCSVDTDGITEMISVSKEIALGSDVGCRKCGIKPVEVVLKKTDPYCGACFLSYATHKFRSCLGKHKLLPSGACVLVGSSGGAASSALLHLVKEGLALTTNKRLRLEPAFIHVDEQCCSSIDTGYAAQRACDAVLRLGFPCYYTTLEAALSPQPLTPVLYSQGCNLDNLRHQTSSPELQTQLESLMQGCNSDTARESVCSSLLARCLVSSAVSLQYPWLLQGHSASRVATEILASMAEGAGSHIAARVGFVHRDPTSGVSVVRPLRELQHEELLQYLALYDLPYIEHHHTNNTIRGCTHNFLSGLQEGFPSTIPTVFRTGDKLLGYSGPAPSSRSSSVLSLPAASSATVTAHSPDTVNSINGSNNHRHVACDESDTFAIGLCELCHLTLDTNQPTASALEATVLSLKLSKAPCGSSSENDSREKNSGSKVSERDCPTEDNDPLVCGSSNSARDGGCAEPSDFNPQNRRDEFNDLLCYACRITLQKLDNLSLLPPDVSAKATMAQQRQLIASGVADYLL